MTCLTIEAEKHPLAMDEPQNRSFFHSIAFVIYFWAMEKCAGTRFFIPSGFRKGFWRWKKVAEEAIYTPSDSTKAPARWKQVPARPRHSIKTPARWKQVPARPRHKASPIVDGNQPLPGSYWLHISIILILQDCNVSIAIKETWAAMDSIWALFAVLYIEN